MDIYTLANNSRLAAYALMTATTQQKNEALTLIANALESSTDKILHANKIDLGNATANGMPKAMLDRLALSKERIKAMADGLRAIADLNDPIGSIDEGIMRPNGLLIQKKRVPLGVIGIIYEARPNVTADAIGLCIKTSNAVILRGGSDAINSNMAIVEIAKDCAYQAGLHESCIALIEDTSRETASKMMRLNGYIDVLIPRGGAGLIKSVIENATVPVIETGTGNCHVYVDDSADLEMASKIIYNAKCTRPAVCNSAEKLLVARSIAPAFLQLIHSPMKAKGVEIRGCRETCALLPYAFHASEEDWYKEYSDYILGIKVVDGLSQAIGWINTYGTKHSEAIVTENYSNAQRFLAEIDAAAVYVNASTRFTDGSEFGFGAEIGISTQKLHARGPMGLKELTTIKYCILGNGQIR